MQKKYNKLSILIYGGQDSGRTMLTQRLIHESLKSSDIKFDHEESDKETTIIGQLLKKGELNTSEEVKGAEFSTSKYNFIITDCNGHKNFVQNLLTRQKYFDVALFIVSVPELDAKYNDLEQQIALLNGSPIQNLIICINKIDLIKEEPQINNYI